MPDESLEGQLAFFADFVRDHARGTVADEAAAALKDVVARVQAVGKPGKVTLTYTILPAGPGGRMVSVTGEVTTKVPTPDPEPSLFFIDENGGLSRDDPFNRPHPGLVPPRTVDPETGEIRRLEDQ